jgi:Leucine-rich repeat (LRR) protein
MYLCVCRLKSMVECDVSTNFLTVIPESITALAHLRLLDVHDNRIQEVPPNTSRLVCLEELNVSENRIKRLDSELGMVPSLRKVIGSHNPLIDPPEEVAVVSGEKCCEYICNLGRAREVKKLYLHGMNLRYASGKVALAIAHVCVGI